MLNGMDGCYEVGLVLKDRSQSAKLIAKGSIPYNLSVNFNFFLED